ncbi:MAG: HlyD family efflux transporter periplasmic adaptor subunit [Cyanobacteria bacterium P01_A01_bin.135]
MNANILPHQSAVAKLPQRWLILGAAALGLAGLTWGITQRSGINDEAQTEVVASPEVMTVTALGRLEPEGEIINLTAPTSTQESRVDELRVQEGDRVEAGQIVAVLDNNARLEASLQQAEGQVRIAEAQLAQVRAGAKTGELQAQRSEIARLQADQAGNINTQRATIARLEAEVENARVEYQRYDSLSVEGAVSASERDARLLTYQTAQRQLEEARAALDRIQTTSAEQISQARATLDQIAEVRPVDVTTAEAAVAAAEAAVAEARTQVEQTLVRSPRAGQIIAIHTRPGETVESDGIATLGNTDQMMAIAEVYQSDVAQIEVGQPVEITSPAIPDVVMGTVERIGLQVEQQEVVDEDPATNIDARVVEVDIRLDPDASAQVAGLSNLQIMATIRTD